MQITITKFEKIDWLMSTVLRMGPFETCADPRGYVRAENHLYDALIDGVGRDYADSFPSALEAAAAVVTDALLCRIEVVDEEAA
jgi:hypothetical protein